jgi:hypothetical protein
MVCEAQRELGVDCPYYGPVLVVTDGFRSQRTVLIYHAVLDAVRIQVGCMPVFAQTTPKSWTKARHGIEEGTKQFLKMHNISILCPMDPIDLKAGRGSDFRSRSDAAKCHIT